MKERNIYNILSEGKGAEAYDELYTLISKSMLSEEDDDFDEEDFDETITSVGDAEPLEDSVDDIPKQLMNFIPSGIQSNLYASDIYSIEDGILMIGLTKKLSQKEMKELGDKFPDGDVEEDKDISYDENTDTIYVYGIFFDPENLF